MSAIGSLLSIFWLCLKPITRRLFSPRWQYYIWLTVLIVMILPIRIPVSSRIPDIPTFTVNQSVNTEAEVSQMNNNTVDTQLSTQQTPISVLKAELPRDILHHTAYIWLFGVLIALLTKIIKYNLFLRALHKNSAVDRGISDIPKRIKVRRTDMLDAPLIVGLFNPTLFLPNIEIEEADMNYILMHELTHCKRGDLLYKWFAMTVSGIHWFNPFVYVVLNQIDTECEVSCDFAVTNKLSDDEKNRYMNMILDLLANSKNGFKPLTTQMASNKKTLKRRFTMIRNKKATSKFMSVISALVTFVILSTTVFASGVLQNNFNENDVKFKVYNGDKQLVLNSEPFIYDSEYFLPLRDILNGFGVTDIVYNNGVITVNFPNDTTGDTLNSVTLKIGKALTYYGESSPGGYAVVKRYAPVLSHGVTFVTVDYFEEFMKLLGLRGFRLNVIRPTEPENYYTKNEKVFVGTAEEQDRYDGDPAKRIIVDENGETIAVIPVENQIPQNIEEKFAKTEIASSCDSFYQAFYNQAFGCFDTEYDSVFESSLMLVSKSDEYIAYIGIADVIKIPQNELNKTNDMIITNTYTSN